MRAVAVREVAVRRVAVRLVRFVEVDAACIYRSIQTGLADLAVQKDVCNCSATTAVE